MLHSDIESNRIGETLMLMWRCAFEEKQFLDLVCSFTNEINRKKIFARILCSGIDDTHHSIDTFVFESIDPLVLPLPFPEFFSSTCDKYFLSSRNENNEALRRAPHCLHRALSIWCQGEEGSRGSSCPRFLRTKL